jgi:hypothetical protein
MVRAQPAAEASSFEGYPSRGLLDPLMSPPRSADRGDQRTLRECPCGEANLLCSMNTSLSAWRRIQLSPICSELLGARSFS